MNFFDVGPHHHDAGSDDQQSSFQRLKHWIERRLSDRRQVNISVMVLQGMKVQGGLLTDMSEHGFGLSKVLGLVVDEIVSIATQESQVFTGRVVWVEGSRAGVHLISEG